jgi:alpha-galactosidase
MWLSAERLPWGLASRSLSYDKWIPSVLFLTHYLPDDPAESQVMCVASLILGQNGIWGDLPAVSDEGVQRIGSLLAHYVNVRDDITAASPCRTGDVATSPEVHEKINPANGRGAIVIFSASGGTFHYASRQMGSPDFHATPGVDVRRLESGRVVIRVAMAPKTAAIVFFGTR